MEGNETSDELLDVTLKEEESEADLSGLARAREAHALEVESLRREEADRRERRVLAEEDKEELLELTRSEVFTTSKETEDDLGGIRSARHSRLRSLRTAEKCEAVEEGEEKEEEEDLLVRHPTSSEHVQFAQEERESSIR